MGSNMQHAITIILIIIVLIMSIVQVSLTIRNSNTFESRVENTLISTLENYEFNIVE